MKTFLARGVPRAVLQDAWWMSADTVIEQPPETPDQDRSKRDWVPLAGLIGLVALADVLIWQVTPGLSLGVFALALWGAAWTALRRRWDMRRDTQSLGLAVLAILPILEMVQLLSLAVFASVFSAALVRLVAPRLNVSAMVRLWQFGPQSALRRLVESARAPRIGTGSSAKSLGLTWGLPLGLGLVFVGLLLDANPMLGSGLDWLAALAGEAYNVPRMVFWAGMAVLIWPALSLLDLRERLALPLRLPATVPDLPEFINAGSVARSLILFNVLFALQTVTDIAYLWSGAALPEGLSYAEYAHRGAYPLLVTALLAGAFAVISRPFTTGSAHLRLALLLWVAQNVLLVVSSIYRLELYVEVYGLTRLRLAAAIWMGVVALGLCLAFWQIWRHRDVLWLVSRSALLGLGVLYGCCFLSFDRQIAQYNLTHDVPLDRAYLCYLGAAALPAIRAAEQREDRQICISVSRPQLAAPQDWREWGFRTARVQRSLAQI